MVLRAELTVQRKRTFKGSMAAPFGVPICRAADRGP